MDAPSPAAVAANSRGMAALKAGNAKAAAAAFAEACTADPQSPALWRNLASARRAAGDDHGELAALDGALAIDRRDVAAWLRKAETHQRRGDKAAALAAWSGVLQLAEPLRPWEGAFAASLAVGQRFVVEATAELRLTTEAMLGAAAGELDETEARRGRAFLDIALGGRQTFVNECAGLYYPFLPADEFFDAAHFPWFGALATETDAIRAELRALLDDPGDALRPYVRMEKGIGETKWSGLDGTLQWGACFLYEYGAPNVAVLDRCPATARALAAIPQSTIPRQAPNAFFSILQPRTRIPAHTGVSNTRAIVHLPLIVPEGCGFRVGGETREWIEGQPFAFDDTIEHEAWNDSDAMRAVLILDVWNPHLSEREQRIVSDYYRSTEAAGYAPVR